MLHAVGSQLRHLVLYEDGANDAHISDDAGESAVRPSMFSGSSCKYDRFVSQPSVQYLAQQDPIGWFHLN